MVIFAGRAIVHIFLIDNPIFLSLFGLVGLATLLPDSVGASLMIVRLSD